MAAYEHTRTHTHTHFGFGVGSAAPRERQARINAWHNPTHPEATLPSIHRRIIIKRVRLEDAVRQPSHRLCACLSHPLVIWRGQLVHFTIEHISKLPGTNSSRQNGEDQELLRKCTSAAHTTSPPGRGGCVVLRMANRRSEPERGHGIGISTRVPGCNREPAKHG